MKNMLIVLAVTIGLSGCGTTENKVLEGPIPDVINGSATHTYRYQFNLRDYLTDYTLIENTPYSINIPNVQLSYNPKNMIYGVSDDKGFTAPIFLDHPIDEKMVRLLHRYGEGKLGEVFLVSDQNKIPVQRFSYRLAVSCPSGEAYTLQGITDRNGYSVFVAMDEVCWLCLSSGDAGTFEVMDSDDTRKQCSLKGSDNQ